MCYDRIIITLFYRVFLIQKETILSRILDMIHWTYRSLDTDETSQFPVIVN